MSTAAASAKRWAREYETIYILRPTVDAERAEKVSTRVSDVIARLDGTITKVDTWGKRRLAYTIKKHTRGIFVYVRYVGFSDLVLELERNLRLLDDVIRFQTVRLRDFVDPADVSVDAAEVEFEAIDFAEEEPEMSRAASLGLEDRHRAPRDGAADADDTDTDGGDQSAEDAKGGEAAEGDAPAEGDAEAAEGDAPAAEDEAKPAAEAAAPSEAVADKTEEES